jgi:hypothetical protein
MKMKSGSKAKCTDNGMRVKQAQMAAGGKKMKNGDYSKQLKKEEKGYE